MWPSSLVIVLISVRDDKGVPILSSGLFQLQPLSKSLVSFNQSSCGKGERYSKVQPADKRKKDWKTNEYLHLNEKKPFTKGLVIVIRV